MKGLEATLATIGAAAPWLMTATPASDGGVAPAILAIASALAPASVYVGYALVRGVVAALRASEQFHSSMAQRLVFGEIEPSDEDERLARMVKARLLLASMAEMAASAIDETPPPPSIRGYLARRHGPRQRGPDDH